ncbi:MAG TPA: hypothetical protein VLU91_07060 [Nitrososphaerales archaeon]|nr:hypothetical protein [Nitrososphaerales archaeon]
MVVNHIGDDYMRRMLGTTRQYTIVILHRTSKRGESFADKVVWEHGRRNFELRRDGLLCIVCPVIGDKSDVTGLCIFSTGMEETRKIMDEDPAVKAGIFTYEAHSVDGFPGDALAA